MNTKWLMILVLTLTSLFNSALNNAASAAVSPIMANYGNVGPGLADVNLEVFRDSSTGPWYVTFNLLAPGNIAMGVDALPVASPFVECCFTVTAIRLTTFEGDHVAFGTNVIPSNPFAGSIDHLLSINSLGSGHYALEVSGFGNRDTQVLGNRTNATDFVTRLTVTPVPVPAAAWLFGSGVFMLFGRSAFRKKNV